MPLARVRDGVSEHCTWVPEAGLTHVSEPPQHTHQGPSSEPRAQLPHCLVGTVFRKVLSQRLNMEKGHLNL